jgi:NADP-dependent 3-hydroxy acid dehydrogenase YdfG
MTPEPAPGPRQQGTGKLAGKIALISGGDSGIGRAVAVLFAREGAEVAIGHLAEEATDANQTVKLVQAEGRRCLTLPGDVGDEAFCQEAVAGADLPDQHLGDVLSDQGGPAPSGCGLGDCEHHLGHRLPGQPEPG